MSKKAIGVGIIGVGKMGEALIRGLQKSKHHKNFDLRGSVKRKERAQKISKDLAIPCSSDNSALVKQSKVIVLAVKPHQAKEVLGRLAHLLTSKHLVISICAAINHQQLNEWSGGRAKVIRAMPNLPALIGQGMTVLTPGPEVGDADRKIAEDIFSSVGKTVQLEEGLLDGVTALSACGPAFIFLIIESLSEAGVKVGIPRDISTQLAAQTMKGSAQMVLEQGKHPAALKDEVTTPAGCTIDGLMALEDGKLRATLIRAVLASTERSASLRNKS